MQGVIHNRVKQKMCQVAGRVIGCWWEGSQRRRRTWPRRSRAQVIKTEDVLGILVVD